MQSNASLVGRMPRKLATILYRVSGSTAAGVGNVCPFNVQHHVVDSGILIACRQIGRTEQIRDVTTLSYVKNMQQMH